MTNSFTASDRAISTITDNKQAEHIMPNLNEVRDYFRHQSAIATNVQTEGSLPQLAVVDGEYARSGVKDISMAVTPASRMDQYIRSSYQQPGDPHQPDQPKPGDPHQPDQPGDPHQPDQPKPGDPHQPDQPPLDRVDQRQLWQQQRIYQGVRSGQLTMDEFLRLEKGQEEIAALEAKLRADGKLSEKDKELLERKQNEESKRIYEEKHDKDKQAKDDREGKTNSKKPDQLDSIDQRQQRQQSLIFDGIKSGELTMGEFLDLERRHERFAALEQKYRGDGNLSTKELEDLNARLDKLSKRIYRQKHNDSPPKDPQPIPLSQTAEDELA